MWYIFIVSFMLFISFCIILPIYDCNRILVVSFTILFYILWKLSRRRTPCDITYVGESVLDSFISLYFNCTLIVFRLLVNVVFINYEHGKIIYPKTNRPTEKLGSRREIKITEFVLKE